jgi:hypothetical protein
MYWENKCFFCLFYGTLAAIIGLSVKPIYKDIKKAKHEKVINTNVYADTTSKL